MGIRITRLEPVNLAAIQEYEEELKRKEYLDCTACGPDRRALETLEAAIAKIDRKDTHALQGHLRGGQQGHAGMYFPRLFGGGHAYLEMTGEDLLTTGVEFHHGAPAG